MGKESYNRFVMEYLKDFNATRAAKAAGYSEKTAYSQGQRLLKNVEVKSKIKSALEEVLECDTLALKNRIIDELCAIAFDPDEIDIRRNRDGEVLDVSRKDKIRALELLGKYMALFTENVKVSGDKDNPVKVEMVSLAEILEKGDK